MRLTRTQLACLAQVDREGFVSGYHSRTYGSLRSHGLIKPATLGDQHPTVFVAWWKLTDAGQATLTAALAALDARRAA